MDESENGILQKLEELKNAQAKQFLWALAIGTMVNIAVAWIFIKYKR